MAEERAAVSPSNNRQTTTPRARTRRVAGRNVWCDPVSPGFAREQRPHSVVRVLRTEDHHGSSSTPNRTRPLNSPSPGTDRSLTNLLPNHSPNTFLSHGASSTAIREATLPTYIQSELNSSNAPDSVSLSKSLKKLKDDDDSESDDFADDRRRMVRNPLKRSSVSHLGRFSSTSSSDLEHAGVASEVLAMPPTSDRKSSEEIVNPTDTAFPLGGDGAAQVLMAELEEGPDDGKRLSLIDVHSLDSDDEPSKREDREPHVCFTFSSLPAVAFIMCVGAVVVGLLGFLPFYFVGVRSNSLTTGYLLSEAMKGVASITENSLAMLPAFVHIVTFNYIKTQITTLNETNLPSTPEQLLTSLLTVLTRFNQSIFYIRFIYEGDLYTNAGYTEEYTQVFGGYTDTPTTVPLNEVYEGNVSFVDGPGGHNKLRDFDFAREVTMAAGPMEQIVKPWAKNTTNHTRWLLASDNETSTYFNFVMPFSVDSNLGYCEAGSSSDTVIGETTTLVPFLREHGRIFLIDNTRNILVGNSWNQSLQTVSTDPVTNKTTFIPTKVYEINEGIIQAAMRQVNASGGLAAILTGGTKLVPFSFEGAEASLNLTRVSDSYGLDLILGVVVVRADFEKAFSTARTAVIAVTVVVVAIAAVVAVVIAWFVVREMKRLIPQLIRASNLEVSRRDEKDNSVHGWLACITEIRGIHQAFVRVEKSLREMRTFVPAAVMTQATSDGSRSDIDFGDGKTRRVRTRFNANIVKDNTNEFSRVDVAMVLVDVHRAMDTSEARLVMDIISQRAEEHTGFIESVSTSSFFLNFGTQSQNPLVVSKICNFALEVYSAVPDQLRNHIVCFAVRMPFLVGTCGAKHSKARVVFDTQKMLDISKVLWDIGCHVASTTDTLSHFATSSSQIPWYRIDCVRFPDEVSQVTLCELREPNALLVDNVNMPKKMGDGLSKMCKGEYKEALQIFDSVHSDNVQLKRLRQICLDRASTGDTSKYIHLIQDVYALDAAGSRSADVAIGEPPVFADMTPTSTAPNGEEAGVRRDPLVDVPIFSKSFLHPTSILTPSQRAQLLGDAPTPLARHTVTNTKTNTTSAVAAAAVVAASANTSGGEAMEPSRLTEKEVDKAMGPRPPAEVGGPHGLGLPPLLPKNANMTGGGVTSSIPGSNHAAWHVTGGSHLGTSSHLQDQVDAMSFLTDAFVFDSSVASAEAIGAAVPSSADEPQVLRDVNQHEWQVSLFPVGSGAFSAVYLGMSDDGVQVAIKRIPRLHRGIKEEEMVSEVCTCAKLRHPNIVPYISCCVTQSYLAIIMEYMPGGSLHDIIENFGKLPRTVVRRFMLDIVNGLAYLHESTTHGDVKPHNILLGVDGVCKLSDFGSASDKLTEAACVNEDRLLRGTAVYISPEGARNLPLTSASDIYSLGISFLEMVLGRLPWRWADLQRQDALPLRSDHEFVQCLIAGVIVVDIPDNLDHDMRELALAACAEVPENRPTAQELLSFSFLI
ncbi:putative serine/threonine protein kinase [Leptomonas pyrrhocoris]|uniref:Putative serine/threonine protein kinase n=1 Tax=Leptomonas pyrrhocoris TaxID=157538 RepID=A0A0M9G8F4_LEPPY|nr:putative serine/threonine protein kinase [Leptomonas pyrrhocoris]KPA84589.1 putative serine/threonine protein kinase [Leptomonas pyrrhocoris]|eukprot:XP_015663028.1 putative serine/threonine protein kinase [Leptomonas pyrrhocoris]